MENLLFLCQRIPYPPNKGDKIRSWHILRHLARTHRIFLGCFIDDAEDSCHLDVLKNLCAEVFCFKISPRLRQFRALARLRSGRPLTLDYFHDRRLQHWVDTVVARHAIRRSFVFSSSMAPYALNLDGCRVLDLVDLDSAKWAEYAERRRWPLSAVFLREARTLAEFEQEAALRFDRTLLVSDAEADDFGIAAPALTHKVAVLTNGVDLDYFSAAREYASPFPEDVRALVFTGAMDYWPNIDAVEWFADELFPRLREGQPELAFYIVGSRPDVRVQRLAAIPGVTVTGRVPDTRPFLAHAFAAIAPLRVARGIQNKVLEAMAMRTPVVASMAAARGVGARPGVDFLTAETPEEWRRALQSLTPQEGLRLAAAGRNAVAASHCWNANLSALDELFPTWTQATVSRFDALLRNPMAETVPQPTFGR